MNDLGHEIFTLITDHLHQCESSDDLEACINRVTELIGAKSFIYNTYLTAYNEINSVHNMNLSWVERYIEQNYNQHDPRIAYGMLHCAPVKWTDLSFSSGPIGKLEKIILDEAATYGYGDGITIPIHGVGSDLGVLNFAAPKGELPDYSAAELSMLSLFGLEFQQKFKHVRTRDSAEGRERAELSQREKNIMSWIMIGKTSWEIAKILGCSEATINFHIKNVTTKLGTINRTHAVAKVLSEAYVRHYGHLLDRDFKPTTKTTIRIP